MRVQNARWRASPSSTTLGRARPAVPRTAPGQSSSLPGSLQAFQSVPLVGRSRRHGSHIARLAARDGLFYDAVNNVVELKGANCFGFSPTDNQLGETPAVSSALTAMWGSNNSELQDFETVVFRLKLLGFNAIRLPFRFKVSEIMGRCRTGAGSKTLQDMLGGAPPDYSSTQDLQEHRPLACKEIVAQLPEPLFNDQSGAMSGENMYLPSTIVLDTFIFVVRHFIDQGFHVVLENHVSQPTNAHAGGAMSQLGSPYWIKKWKDLIYSTIYESSPTNSSRSDFLTIDIRDESKAGVSSSAGLGGKWDDLANHTPYVIDDFLTEQQRPADANSRRPKPYWEDLAQSSLDPVHETVQAEANALIKQTNSLGGSWDELAMYTDYTVGDLVPQATALNPCMPRSGFTSAAPVAGAPTEHTQSYQNDIPPIVSSDGAFE